MTDEREPNTDDARPRRFPAARVRQPGVEAVPDEDRGLAPKPIPDPSRSPFAPRSLAGGRVHLFGCSPALLLISLGVSVVLTILLNLMFGPFF